MQEGFWEGAQEEQRDWELALNSLGKTICPLSLFFLCVNRVGPMNGCPKSQRTNEPSKQLPSYPLQLLSHLPHGRGL